MTQKYYLASLTAPLSSIGISHHNLLPHMPSICLSAVNGSPHLGIDPQSLNSSSQPLHHLGYVWLWQGLSDSIWRPQISCFTLSLKCFSSDPCLTRLRKGDLLQRTCSPSGPTGRPVSVCAQLIKPLAWGTEQAGCPLARTLLAPILSPTCPVAFDAPFTYLKAEENRGWKMP